MILAIAAAKAQPFNADLYTVAATVIPVLFLAIAVQGNAYDEFLRLLVSATRRAHALQDATGWQRQRRKTHRHSA
jgi:hypothetical protein